MKCAIVFLLVLVLIVDQGHGWSRRRSTTVKLERKKNVTENVDVNTSVPIIENEGAAENRTFEDSQSFGDSHSVGDSHKLEDSPASNEDELHDDGPNGDVIV
ncbi:uncharacterized protein LOC135690205 [Rhopilema esculentum]|uniref:uncharacterized protein LOC135690205 n=1 Tax=Rhopilema esculentum TaxID=499914 RepID=UPI0031D445BB